jgi:hypothetical protein
MPVPSGRLDLLYTYQTRLLLLELKVSPFQFSYMSQVLRYKEDIEQYQRTGKLVQGDVEPYLLCTSVDPGQRRKGIEKGVICVSYKPEEVLRYFYDNLKPLASLTDIKPIDIGIWNLHLINKMMYLLASGSTMQELPRRLNLSPKTVYNKVRFAHELGLVHWTHAEEHVTLSELGREYTMRGDSSLPDHLSEAQIDLIRDRVIENPYESCVILGIASIVECVFVLLRNVYPVPMSELIHYFSDHVGKHFDWKTNKAKYNATRMYCNYAVDLGLLAKSGDSVYMTPEGSRFIIQMQLHKSLRMMRTLTIT